MKAAASIVLAGLLVALPITQVAAQTERQDSTTADASLVPEERSQHVLGVPALTPAVALLWQPIAENRAGIFDEPSLSDPAPVPGWDEWSTEKRVLVVGGVVVGLMVLGLLSIG